MAATKESLRFFKNFDHQEQMDLQYGEQAEPCAHILQYLQDHPLSKDLSISGDWTPETD